jgi:hypothetical protein
MNYYKVKNGKVHIMELDSTTDYMCHCGMVIGREDYLGNLVCGDKKVSEKEFKKTPCLNCQKLMLRHVIKILAGK